MISIKGLKKSFGAQVVLDDLFFEIPDGKITVIIGRSGEGKSVLLKHMMGLIRPDSGEVVVDGVSLFTLDDFQLNENRKQFGMLFQNAALFDSMTVFENIAFPLVEHSVLSGNKITERVNDLISLVGMDEVVLKKFPSELSGGMRKRVGLARAIALKPKILLYDEPTTGLDPVMTDVVDHLILNTQKKLKVTSVVISHDISAVYAIADKIAMLHEGKILMDGTPDEFKNTNNEVIKNFLEGRATGEQLKDL
ncbi:MAG: ABC transporter ATP-binding protein [Deltaproteobacteria bacterium]|nr:ABC transporter ATP-binding protein [Deltaproteobacteria bacterium]